MEALSCRRPVVATDVGSIDESVIDGQTGFLVLPGDADNMSDRWCRLLSDTQLASQFGDAGRNHIMANSSLQSMTDGYTQLIETTFAIKTKSNYDQIPAQAAFSQTPATLQSGS